MFVRRFCKRRILVDGGEGKNMDSRQRIRMALDHKEPDRVPIHDSPWASTVGRWRREGLPEGISPADYFDYEIVMIGCDTTPRFPIRTLEKTRDYIVQTTSTGGINRNRRDHASTPEIVERPIEKKQDWNEMRERLQPDFTRVDWVSAFNTYHLARSEGKFITLVGGYGYDILQSYVRSENLLMALADDPDWVKDMIMTLARLVVDMASMMMEKGLDFDGFFCLNDMGYRNGLLFSPETYRRTHKEADTMVYSFFHEHNMPVILHSCGCVKEAIPDLIEAGLDCLQPLEVKAGMDLVQLKREYGESLAFMGGIDTRTMIDPDPQVLENEIRTKFEAAKKGGGYIYHSDHSIPDNVSFEQYERVMALVNQYGAY